ncbi:MAG: transketolase [Patescibacteria group bacterium]|nr:transketolase [Patescibacteria group bacterium]
METKNLEKIARLLRYYILFSTTTAGSGHPTSCLSSVELLTALFFGGFFCQDLKNPKAIYNDRFILSKGHASPLLYSLYVVAGVFKKEELLTLRKFGSIFEGHPTQKFPYVEVATGSLGQGLSIGLGMAMGIKLKIKSQKLKIERTPKVFVLLGDSEMAEGQIWEATELASYYKVKNLIAIADISRLGQNSQTMIGWNLSSYKNKFEAFGWKTYLLEDGHNLRDIIKIYQLVEKDLSEKPKIILAKTIKGRGVSFLEDKEGWHGKALNQNEFNQAVRELGNIDFKIKGKIKEPKKIFFEEEKNENDEKIFSIINKLESFSEKKQELNHENFISTRESYGRELEKLGQIDKNIIVLDAETANSTYENLFAKKFPDRFIEVFIAEQNMISIGLGLSKIGFKVFMSTFSAFLTRAFDQIRMAQYSDADLKIAGSHAGVSIGEDGASQMGLEDIAMFNSILNSVIFYPSDKTSTEKLTKIAKDKKGIIYLRLTRGKTPIIYKENEEFNIPGFKIHKINLEKNKNLKKVLIITAGITLFEALKSQKELIRKYQVLVIDLYCLKPLDKENLKKIIGEYKNILVIEDHYPGGGIGSIVSQFILEENIKINYFIHLACRKIPHSGSSRELLEYEKINSQEIINQILKI